MLCSAASTTRLATLCSAASTARLATLWPPPASTPRLATLARRCHRPRSTARAMAASLPAGPVFFMDGFVARQWGERAAEGTRFDPGAGGPTMAEFCDAVHAAHAAGDAPLVDGYAPFCKHVFIPNFVPGIKAGAVAVTPANEGQLRSGYARRRPEELAVLARWFPADCPAALSRPDATWLDVILYSREQLAAEAAALPASDRAARTDGLSGLPPWGIISVKAQDCDHELPMQPITMLRNALGKEQGGSGVALDRAAYEAAVEYWSAHAAVLDGAVAGA